MADYPSAVEDTLAVLLPQYQEDRNRWPLWTYRRRAPTADGGLGVSFRDLASLSASSDESGKVNLTKPSKLPERLSDAPTWYGLNWPQRLQFAPRYTVFRILESLPHTRGPGHNISLHLDHRPPLVQAQILASFAATAADGIPETVADIDVPANWHRQANLDDRDRDEVQRAVMTAFFSKWTRPGWPVTEHRSGLEYLIEASVQAGRKPSERSEPWSENLGETIRELLSDLLERFGIRVTFRGSSPRGVPAAHLLQLEREARDIAAAVRTWRPRDERLREGVLGLLPANPDTPAQHRLVESVKQGHVQPERDPVRRLRFPFLTAEEIEGTFTAIESQDVDADSRAVTSAGRKLLVGRLLSISSPSTLEKELSKARHELP